MATQLDRFVEVFDSRVAEKNRIRRADCDDEGSATTEEFTGFSRFQSASKSSAEYGYSSDDDDEKEKKKSKLARMQLLLQKVMNKRVQRMLRNLRKTRVLQDQPQQLQQPRRLGREQLRLMDPSQPQQE